MTSFAASISISLGSSGFGTAARKVSERIARIADAGREATDATEKMTNSFARLQSRLSAAGRTTLATASSARVEEQMAKVSAVSRATRAAQGMEYLATSGLSLNDALAAMPSTLAHAGATNLGRTLEFASDILEEFGLSASEMPRMADTRTTGCTRADVDPSILGQTMKYVAALARAADRNVGIRDTMVGTALRAIAQSATGKSIGIMGVGFRLPKPPNAGAPVWNAMSEPVLPLGGDSWSDAEQSGSVESEARSIEWPRLEAARTAHRNIESRREYTTNNYFTIRTAPSQSPREIADEIRRRQEQARLSAHHDGDEL